MNVNLTVKVSKTSFKYIEKSKYFRFCNKREADPYNSNDTIIIEFVTQEFERGMSSSAINGMITEIKKINSQASTEVIRTFKKRAFNLRPPVTKYLKILKSANWTGYSNFKKYYKKEIDQLYCDFRGENDFAISLLSSFY